MAAGCNDGLGGEEIGVGVAGSVNNFHIEYTGTVATLNVTTLGSIAHFKADTGSPIDLEIQGTGTIAGAGIPVAYTTGSPSALDRVLIQAGSSTMGAGSDVAVAFPTAFTGVPAVSTDSGEVPGGIINGSRYDNGSVVFICNAAMAGKAFRWMAIGDR